MKNIKDLSDTSKSVQAQALFKGGEGTATRIFIKGGAQLPEHTTKTTAMLLCVEGTVTFGNEHNVAHQLDAGDYLLIEPDVKHWVDAAMDSYLLLFK